MHSHFHSNRRCRSLLSPRLVRPLTASPSLNTPLVPAPYFPYLRTRSLGSPTHLIGSTEQRPFLLPMGLLDHLWDDTVAGPRPENGLGKLRKHHTFSFRSSFGKEPEAGSVRSYGDDSPEDAVRVTRSIMIVKPPGYQSGSPPVSPAGSTTPVSPFSGARESFRFRRKSTSDAYEKTGQNRSSPSSPFDV